jgi:hypothetical protein
MKRLLVASPRTSSAEGKNNKLKIKIDELIKQKKKRVQEPVLNTRLETGTVRKGTKTAGLNDKRQGNQ